VALDDDVLQPLAEHRLDGVLVLGRNGHHVGHELHHPGLGPLAGAGPGHQAAHAAAVALVVAQHLLQRLEPGAAVGELLAQRDEAGLVLDELGAGAVEQPLLCAALLLEVELQLPGLPQLLDVGRSGAVERGGPGSQVVDLGADAPEAGLEVGALPLDLGERAAARRGPAVRIGALGASGLRLGDERPFLPGDGAQRPLEVGEPGLVGSGEARQLVALPEEGVPLGGQGIGLDLEDLDLGGLSPGALGDLVELPLGGLGRDGRDAPLALQLVLPLGELLQGRLSLGEERAVGLEGQVDLGEAGRDLRLLGARARVPVLGLAPPHRQLEPARGAHVELQLPDLGLERAVALGLAGLPVEGVELLAQLEDDVGDPLQVVAGGLHLPLGGLATLLVLGDSGRLLDHRAAILGPGRHDLADAPLLDDRVGGATHAGAEEDVVHVEEPRRGAVDEVVRLAGAVKPSPHGDLGESLEGGGQLGGAVVLEGDRHLGQRERGLRLRPVEDHVLHRAAAQPERRLLPQDPADGVGDVRLPAAVGPDDPGHALVEDDDRPVHEGLETHHLQTANPHVAGIA
jgi:hypothetical protein